MIVTGANHVCVVTRDLERAVRTWANRYGVGPWSIWTKDDTNMSACLDGRPASFAMRVALCSLSPTFRLELIQPLDDASPYAASLVRHGDHDHIHHLRLDVADYAVARQQLEALDLGVPLDASFDGAPGVESKVAATYFDTEDDLGFVLEIAHLPHGFAMPEPEQVYPATDNPEEALQ